MGHYSDQCKNAQVISEVCSGMIDQQILMLNQHLEDPTVTQAGRYALTSDINTQKTRK